MEVQAKEDGVSTFRLSVLYLAIEDLSLGVKPWRNQLQLPFKKLNISPPP